MQNDTFKVKRVRRGDARATLIHGDNLLAMDVLRARMGASIALAYSDPPFFTGRPHYETTRRRSATTGEIVRSSRFAFDDRWSGLGEYVESLAERAAAARRLLIPEGCFVVHVDQRASHYVKVAFDDVFGPACFASEIVWRYRRWPSKTRNFQRVHDSLLRYVCDPKVKPRFNQLFEPLAPSTRATWGDRKQQKTEVEGATGAPIRKSKKTEEKSLGVPLGDVWEIGIVAPIAKERTGYPTQKPEALLRRLIEACTDPGDFVLDPNVGSGTTVAVAVALGRLAIGIDNSTRAIQTAARRLKAQGVDPTVEQVVSI